MQRLFDDTRGRGGSAKAEMVDFGCDLLLVLLSGLD